MALLDSAKKVLRISSGMTTFDDEIDDLIATAKLDLETSGIINIDETDPLIKRAILVYIKSEFGMGNSEADRYKVIYEKMRDKLANTSEYITEVV